MTWAIASLLLFTLALVAGVLACAFAFKANQEADSAETDADRAYRWREEMRAKSHERWRR